MKKVRILTAAMLSGIALTSCGGAEELPAIVAAHKDKASFTKVSDGAAQLQSLFNGKDLTGWYTYTQAYGKNNDAEKAFTVENGVLHFDGESMGYLCT
ncbi:MAG: DUF1080 domain-containing protein, partial [Prevotellaceae bacterium]|nr:DUF1080 domain-containing protein [Prevotellaceae bacterium]